MKYFSKYSIRLKHKQLLVIRFEIYESNDDEFEAEISFWIYRNCLMSKRHYKVFSPNHLFSVLTILMKTESNVLKMKFQPVFSERVTIYVFPIPTMRGFTNIHLRLTIYLL